MESHDCPKDLQWLSDLVSDLFHTFDGLQVPALTDEAAQSAHCVPEVWFYTVTGSFPLNIGECGFQQDQNSLVLGLRLSTRLATFGPIDKNQDT